MIIVRMSTVQKELTNRVKDKHRVENQLGLKEEFGYNYCEIYLTKGQWTHCKCGKYNEDAKKNFDEKEPCKCKKPLTMISIGYNRIVYGDHGPYVELTKEQINWPSFPDSHFKQKPDYSYYDEYYEPETGVMLYAQKKYVTNKANPPQTGDNFTNNNRKEG